MMENKFVKDEIEQIKLVKYRLIKSMLTLTNRLYYS